MNHRLKAFVGIVSAAPILFLVGLAVSFGLYLVWPIAMVYGIIPVNIFMVVGIMLVLVGTVLAFVAQRVSRVVSNPKYKATTCQDLAQGPYKYSRHPGSLAIIMMYIGIALITNSLIIGIVAIVFLLVMTFIFVPMEEQVIAELCPEAYAEYKQNVRMWF